MPQTVRRLPGIRFQTQAPPTPEVLPRMDIAGFVGFAASGPLHVPVPVEDAVQFAQIFGADAPLAWDNARGEQSYAFLGPAVRAFFRNGGRRCWVVRVADAHRASSDLFPVPGLAQIAPDGTLSAAILQARSPGSWADTLRVSAELSPAPLRLEAVTPGTLVFEALVASAGEVAAGDLIRVSFPGSAWTQLFVVAAATTDTQAAPTVVDGAQLLRVAVQGEDEHWVRIADIDPLDNGRLVYLGSRGQELVVGATAEASSPPAPDGLVRLSLTAANGSPPGAPLPPVEAPLPGALVQGSFGTSTVWIDVAGVEAAADGGTTLVGTPLEVSRIAPSPPPVAAPGSLAEKLTLTLRAESDTDAVELAGLGFAPLHPRFVGSLPSDDTLYADPDDPPAAGTFAADAAAPRFPLAGPLPAPAGYLPLGASILPSAPLPAVRPAGSARLRDGLGTFDPAVFLDPQLVESDPRLLIDDADWIRYRSPNPRPLLGAHSLLAVDEVTIVSAPDAVQRDWQGAPGASLPAQVPSAPELSIHGEPDTGLYVLVWTPSDVDDAVYDVQESDGPGFSPPVRTWPGIGPGLDPTQSPELELPDRPPAPTSCFRVRGRSGTAVGAWSNVVGMSFPPTWFADCDARIPSAPVLQKEGNQETGIYTLYWSESDVPGATYELQEDATPLFEGAETFPTGTALEFTLYGRPAGATFYYRVRALAGANPGPWSSTLAVRMAQTQRWFVEPSSAYTPQPLLDLQLALLRMCAARGDLFAVLALPEHYRERETAAHARALRAAAAGPVGEPNPMFGFGALYHPWLYSSDPATPTVFRRTPPDGAAAGVIAARSSSRGAWIAPANEPLRDVVALDPAIGRDAYQLLQDEQVNLVRHEPGGFLWLAADTLSIDDTWRPIGVRRLIQTLRRAALLYGQTYVFEPNGDVFRRTVQRSFEALLTRMFQLGAFAGATPAESFRVNTGSPPNSPDSVDRGELIVELMVAPARPLTFLTVLLVRTGSGELQVETR